MLRYYPKQGVYKGSNVVYHPDSENAYSYGWWQFVGRIKGKLVFNQFKYSNTTAKHQWKVREVLRHLGVQPDLYIESPRGLQDLNSAINWYKSEIHELELDIAKPRTHAKKNAERRLQIVQYKNLIRTIRGLAR